MENTDEQSFIDSAHGELDKIFQESSFDFDEENEINRSTIRDLRTFLKYVRRVIRSAFREKMQNNFTNILYLTLDCPPFTPSSARQDSPLEYITQMQKQYPDNDIRVLIPIIGLGEESKITKKLSVEIGGGQYILERTALSFEFFLQNKMQEAVIYKFPKEVSNIQVYGIYCSSFSEVKDIAEMAGLRALAPFMKSARIAIRKFTKLGFTPDIVHVENIPYYLGCEFELPFSQNPKILQIVKDFVQIEMNKPEAFWAAINLGDENALRKICKDEVIKKNIARLFNRHIKYVSGMRECIQSIYDNYYRFRKYVEQGENLEENAIFNRLNERISHLFPNLTAGDMYYNQMSYSIKRADFWAVYSKTYYKEIYEAPKITGKSYEVIEKIKDKSGYLPYGCEMSEYQRETGFGIYQAFDVNNFRELRNKNKQLLLKEFSSDRIKTNFIDSSLFKNDNRVIVGNLDSFYEAPLLFANPTAEIYANGVDILFGTILKLFELHKNIQVIVAVKGGLGSNFIRSWVKFLSENKSLNGRWVFVDGEINLPKFLAASDMILLPRRVNFTTPEHFLAMYYGCVPVVSRSGILNDTIVDIFDDITFGCGFKTKKSLLTEDDNPEIFLTPLIKALNMYQNNPYGWNIPVKNCLSNNFGWSFKALEKYNNIYQALL